MEKMPNYDYDAMELYQASMNGCIPTLNLLIQKDPLILNKISLTSLCETPLHISVLLGHLDFTRALLALKPNLTFELDYLKRSPLHIASAEGHIEIVRALLHANKDVCMVRDQDERIPLHYAVIRGQVEVVRALISARSDSTWELLDGANVLHLCVKYNHFEVLRLIMESESADDVDFLNYGDGENTILHLAVMQKQLETVKYLLSIPKVKARANTVNRIGFTALDLLEHCPKDFKSFKIRKILMDAGLERSKNQNNVPPSSPTAIVQHESAQLAVPSGWWSKIRSKWIEHLKCQGDIITDTRGSLMVVATVITTMTFQSGISPPGGVWQTNVNNIIQGYGCNANNTCEVGTSVFAHREYPYGNSYRFFLGYNTVAFIASLSVLFLLISGIPLKNKVFMSLLTFAMSTTLTFVAFAYLISICLVNHVFSMAIIVEYVWIGLVVLVLLIYVIRFLVWVSKKIRKVFLRCAVVRTSSTNMIAPNRI